MYLLICENTSFVEQAVKTNCDNDGAVDLSRYTVAKNESISGASGRLEPAVNFYACFCHCLCNVAIDLWYHACE